MPAEFELTNLRRGLIRYFPVVPGRLEFAMEVRRAILAERPKTVAVELPASLAGAYRKAVQRLPQLTVLIYPDEQEDEAVYVPVEPADPFIEALRSAQEVGAGILFLEPDLYARPHLADDAPDSYALSSIGY